MKLFLMRHASAEISIDKRDFDRILTKNGQYETENAADFLCNYSIDKLIVSYAKRTMQTSYIIQKQMSLGKVEIVEELYKQNCEKIIDLLSMQENKFKSVLIIGHNPHIYDLILEFAQHNTKEYAYLLETTMPPARIVVINFPNIHNWQDIRNTKGKIEEIFTP